MLDYLEDFAADFPKRVDEYETLLTDNRIWKQRTVGIGVVSPENALALGHDRPDAARLGHRVGPAQETAVREIRPKSISTFRSASSGDCYDRYLVRVEEMRQSNRIIQQCVKWLKANPGPVMLRQLQSVAASREEMKDDMEALIHHFKLFTEGYCVPAGETYGAVEAPKGEFGCYLMSDGANKPFRLQMPRAGFRASVVDGCDRRGPHAGRRGRDDRHLRRRFRRDRPMSGRRGT